MTLLYGVEAGLGFADLYAAHGGSLASERAARLYWSLLDALAYAPDAEKHVVGWREAGRTDLTSTLVASRLDDYVAALLSRFG